MEIVKEKAIIEAILFSAGRDVKITEFMSVLEIGEDEVKTVIESLKNDYEVQNRGIEIIKVNDGYQMCTRKDYYEYLYAIFDKRAKPNLTNAALETLSIIAYNPRISRAEIESIRGVSSDGTIYKLLEYGLIETAGKLDLPGKPTAYKTTDSFLRTFGYGSLEELPELPKYKLDENQQIVIDEIIEENNENNEDIKNKLTQVSDIPMYNNVGVDEHGDQRKEEE